MSSVTPDNRSDASHAALIAAARMQIEDLRRGSSDARGLSGLRAFPAPPGLHKYRLIRELHRGGQGVVYLAEQQSPHRQVAIKMVREGPLASSGERVRFHREIEALGLLSHPNIVSIHDSGEDTGHLYYVMDYVEGPPLDEYVESRRSRAAASRSRRAQQQFLRETLLLFAKVCDAVQSAHLRGIIHRDLKPSNIRVDPSGEPRVLDFGLAKSTENPSTGQQTLTEAGQFVGTLAFASPEQARGATLDLDVRTDVYSLGVILYQLLTGRAPYSVSGGLSEVIDAIRQSAPVRPSSLAPDLGGDLEVILLTSLQKERERRYQTAGALAVDIRRYLAGEPIDAKRDSTWYVIWKQLSRHRPAVGAAVAILLLIVGGLATSLTLWRKAEHQREVAGQEARKAHAIGDFLHEMLASANPYQRPGEPTQVQEVLEDAERRLTAGAFHAQPDVEASLRNTLGMSYLALGRSEDAIRQLGAALELRKAELPADHTDLAESHHNLGRAYFDHSDYALAEEHLGRALAILNGRSDISTAERLAKSEFWLGMIHQNRGQLPEAGERFTRALSLLGEKGDARLRARCCEGLSAVVSLTSDDLERSADLAREAVAIQRAAYGEHPYLISSLAELGAAAARNLDLAESLSAHREATELCRKFLRRHPETAYCLNRQGGTLATLGQYDEAYACFEEGISILREFFDDDDMRILSLKGRCARVLTRLGRFEEAAALDAESIEVARRLGRRLGLATALINHGDSIQALGRFEEAEAEFRESVEILRAMPPAPTRVHPLSIATRCLGSVLVERGRHAEAEALIRESLELTLTMVQPRGNVHAGTKGLLAECVLARGDFVEAQTLLLQAVDDLEKIPSPPLDTDIARRKTHERLIKLYAAWHTAEPAAGHDLRIAEWQVRLDSLPKPTTLPASMP